MLNRGCRHVISSPPKDITCPWCEIDKLKWELIGEQAKFRASLEEIDQLERRLSLALAKVQL